MILRLAMLGIFFSAAITLPVSAFDHQEFERKRAEHKRKMEETKRRIEESRRRLQMNRSSSGSSTSAFGSGRKQSGSSNSYKSSSKKPGDNFDPKRAPDPRQCFLKFIQTVKAATSMKQVLPYYSANMRDSIEIRQSQYTPDEEERKKKLFGRDYAYHKGNTYERSLRHIKAIVAKTKSIKQVGSKGKRAGVEVKLKDGNLGDYSFVGEDNYWKYNGYKQLTIKMRSR